MKKFSKRALSTLLAVIMVLSVFTIIPITASAETSTPELLTNLPKPNADNTSVVLYEEALKTNALSNSCQRGNTNDTNYDNDANGTAYFAFDGVTTGTLRYLSNAGGASAQGVTLTNFNNGTPVWIQSGFGEGTDNAKLIGGVVYYGETNNSDHLIGDYEIYASLIGAVKNDSLKFGSGTTYEDIKANGILVKSGTFTQTGTNVKEVIYFDSPVKANYITLVAKNPKTNNNAVAALEIQLLSYIEKPTLMEEATAPNESNTIKISNNQTLQSNAVSNSAKRGNINNDADPDNGSPKFAFDNQISVVNDKGRYVQNNNNEKGFGISVSPTESHPVWISSGFGSTEENRKVIGGLEYYPEYNSNPQARAIKDYEIYASYDPIEFDIANASADPEQDVSYAQIKEKSTLVKKGTFKEDISVTNGEVVYFDKPVSANYITLVALSKYGDTTEQTNNTNDNYVISAAEIYFYEYVGETSTAKGKITVKVGDDIIGTIEAEGHSLTGDGDPTYFDEQQVMDAFKKSNIFNNIQYDYDVSLDDGYDGHDKVVKVTQNVHQYSLNVLDVSEFSVVLKPYNDNFEYTATVPNGFKYWADSDGNPVAIGETFNYKATQDYEIKAVYTDLPDGPAAYIPNPIVSRLGTQYKIQIPVSLFNLPPDAKFGIVFANKTEYPTKEELISALKEGNNENYIISKPNDTVTPNNKGRYLHTVTVSGKISESDVYAYIKTADGEYTLSNVQHIYGKAALA